MGDLQVFFLRLGIGFAAAVLLGILCYRGAGKKGRDAVGWFFNGFFPGLLGLIVLAFAFPSHTLWMIAGCLVGFLGLVILLMLPSLETPGQTKRCTGCGKMVRWEADECPGCGDALPVPQASGVGDAGRPLRRFYLYLFLIIILLLIVFGFIGYYCVPDQPEMYSLLNGRVSS